MFEPPKYCNIHEHVNSIVDNEIENCPKIKCIVWTHGTWSMMHGVDEMMHYQVDQGDLSVTVVIVS